MPFDPVNFAPTFATPAEFEAADEAGRLRMLSFALRHHPSSHFWAFAHIGGDIDTIERRLRAINPAIKDRLSAIARSHNCKSAGCALGLANALWGEFSQCRFDTYGNDHLKNIFGMGDDVYEFYGNRCHLQITPSMVADKIDEYLARSER